MDWTTIITSAITGIVGLVGGLLPNTMQRRDQLYDEERERLRKEYAAISQGLSAQARYYREVANGNKIHDAYKNQVVKFVDETDSIIGIFLLERNTPEHKSIEENLFRFRRLADSFNSETITPTALDKLDQINSEIIEKMRRYFAKLDRPERINSFLRRPQS